MKLTKPRKDILKLYENIDYPLNAEEIYNLLNKKYDLSTIYRNLNFFEKNHILKSIVFSDKITYYYRPNGHIHYIYCIKCKKFEKLDMCFEKEYSKYIEEILKFKITDHILYFEGICSNCQHEGEGKQ
ncbi:Fur family transcriptional regulator [Marinitoga sp. 1135]|uniref:Fe2+/Zn2+ uptake regulation protein n=1 Tax=Marinitoga piezophila (strain DSM 14283 / JCM 11233 / KA3) TaxID=443254 RepID=H2J7I7_MARPK|nr:MULTISPECIES: Fur family transcriptional regulator [Marinitoga]AEX86480.1 Fe2+/Zn2+ uptake regulation protein [Marinitoga piezophila KA3]APT76864.1 Fur family transcriptional regulator [Marinitoga sp. 1137]NUU96620.1 Fur family transcriptional regulator [Marinitoga sp. 1135]NUU98556.1 Fur family transcriptional regulator [Marinitoga sp. 1138]